MFYSNLSILREVSNKRICDRICHKVFPCPCSNVILKLINLIRCILFLQTRLFYFNLPLDRYTKQTFLTILKRTCDILCSRSTITICLGLFSITFWNISGSFNLNSMRLFKYIFI